MLMPFLHHWYLSVPDPDAVTERPKPTPSQTLAPLEGWLLIVGPDPVPTALTFRTAPELLTDPRELATSTE
jgi:hypothetical protein